MLFESQIISRGSGSIGGLTASHNKGGNYFRARTTPTDPGTTFQTTVRTLMADLVNLWNSTLTQAQRDAWAVYAVNTPLLNPFGEPRTVTGLNMYTRVNVPKLQAGAARIDTAPAVFNTGSFTPVNIAFSAAGGVSLVFTNTDDWANEIDGQMMLWTSRPQNPGIVFFKGPYRFQGKVDGDAVTPPTSPAVFATPSFAFTEGQRVFGKVAIGTADGRYSVIQRVTAIATA